jgi:hypothetical protein
MNECPKCGQQYPMILTVRPDGTEVYYCTKRDCGQIWGERLVTFDVSFNLVEHRDETCQPTGESIEIGLVASVIPQNGSSKPSDGGNPDS